MCNHLQRSFMFFHVFTMFYFALHVCHHVFTEEDNQFVSLFRLAPA